MTKPRLLRVSTVATSLNILLNGQLKFLSQHFDLVGVSSDGRDLALTSEREGIRTIAVEMQRNIAPLKDLVSLYKLYRIFKQEKPLIIHSITPKAGLLSMLAGKAAGVPIRMHTFTGLIFPSKTGLMQKLLIKTDQLLCWAATNVYPEGRGVKDDLMKFKITKKPLKILGNGNVNGIDVEYFNQDQILPQEKDNLKKKWGFSSEDFIFIFVGRLVKDKGINELMMAFQNLALTQENIKLLLVGNFEQDLDPLYPETLEIINTHKQVIPVGFQTDVRPFFAIANVLVFPSYREGFPNVVLQAGAMGLPSIVTNINGCNEIITDKENGLIIPPKNAVELEQAMSYCLSNNEFYEKAAEKARGKIEKNFRQQIVWDAILSEYKTRMSNV